VAGREAAYEIRSRVGTREGAPFKDVQRGDEALVRVRLVAFSELGRAFGEVMAKVSGTRGGPISWTAGEALELAQCTVGVRARGVSTARASSVTSPNEVCSQGGGVEEALDHRVDVAGLKAEPLRPSALGVGQAHWFGSGGG
jgi:hypothetical protein